MSNPPPPNSKVPDPLSGNESTAPSPEDILSKPHPVRVELDDISNDTREEVAQAMNSEMFVCPIDKFLVSYNPAGAYNVADYIPGCKEYLLDTGVLQQVCGDWRWRDYRTPLLVLKGTDETDVLDDLKHIVNDIFRYAENIQKKRNTFSFQMVPQHESRSGGSESHRKINACLVEAPFTSTLQNHDIIVAFEGKLAWDAKGQVEVREQIMADSHSILCDDPRRMFIYGVTLEDNRMSVWYFSRTHSVKAFAFDWVNKDIDTFIHVMLSFAFGTPQDLGIDPTVHKAPRDNMDAKQHYVYEFEIEAKSTKNLPRCETETATRSKTEEANEHFAKRKILTGKKVYYRTIQSLNDQRPLCISERITRICKVEEVQSIHSNLRVPSTEPVILKDVWADVDLLDEGANQDAIFKAVDMFIAAGLRKYSGPDAMMQFITNEERFKEFNDSMKARLQYLFTGKNYRSLFLTKLHARRGRESKPVSQYAFRCSSRLFSRGSYRVLPEVTIDEQSEATRRANSQPHTVANTRRYPPKVQLRFVYKEVCTEVHALPTFGDVMKVLRQTLDALQIMYCAGWVHRDISIGNIMATPIKEGGQIAGWNVKLADLEFAQPMGYPRHRANSRTGTPYYMPVEIMVRGYLAQKFRIKENTNLVALLRAIGRPVPPRQKSLAGHFNLEPNHPLYTQLNSFQKECLHSDQLGLPAILPADFTTDAILAVGALVQTNYQHDLESIWWIVVYFITMCAGHGMSDAATTFTNANFTHGLDNGNERKNTFTEPIGRTLDALVHPALSDKFTVHLELLRQYMYGQYIARAVFGQMMMHHAYAGVHAEFVVLFDHILSENLGNWQQLPLYKRGVVREVKCGSSHVGDKRGRDDAEGDDDPAGGVNKRLKHD